MKNESCKLLCNVLIISILCTFLATIYALLFTKINSEQNLKKRR
jgi:hypothetical protein